MAEISGFKLNKEIQTKGITKLRHLQKMFQEHPGGYVTYGGKLTKKEALQQLHPELFLEPNVFETKHKGFGTEFPRYASKGELFVRIDIQPHRVFKFDGWKWIEVIKERSFDYLNNQDYINLLIEQINKNECDITQLTSKEQNIVKEYLKDG